MFVRFELERSLLMTRRAKTVDQPTPTRTTPTPPPTPAGKTPPPIPTGKVASTIPSPKNPTASDEEIRVRAYQKWQAAGCPDGDGTKFWLEAERELRRGK